MRTSGKFAVLASIPVLVVGAGMGAALIDDGTASSADEVSHVVVKAGEGWSAVARRCGSTQQALLVANNARSSDPLFVGRVLHCVSGAAPSTTVAASTTTHAHSTVAPTTTRPATTTTRPATTTTRPATTTSVATTTTAAPTGRFATLPPGAALPTEAECASRVRRTPENRPANAVPNATKGSRPHPENPRVTGNFTGTTDEILQWAACKWGVDEDLVRAQIAQESWWEHHTGGDRTSDQAACHPSLRTAPGTTCPESYGLGQVRYLYHTPAMTDSIWSSAYNVDYTYSVWRACFNGDLTWLNTVEREGTYAAGDQWGCTGVWFAGRWMTQPAREYIGKVRGYYDSKVWLGEFRPNTSGSVHPTPTVPSTPPTSTTAPAPTTTTTPPLTTAPQVAPFFESFSDASSFANNWDKGVWHRSNDIINTTEWQGDHSDLGGGNCGDPSTTSRTVHRHTPAESFYVCTAVGGDRSKAHMMTSIGDTAPYSLAWFTPKQAFTTETKVSWEVNVTDLLARKWWEVKILPVTFDSGFTGCRYCTVQPWLSPDPAHVPGYPSDAIVVGKGAFGGDVNIYAGGQDLDNGAHVCDLFPAECKVKPTRVKFSITENRDGTITVDYGGKATYTFRGQFPPTWKLVFTDHSYTPTKDGQPIGLSWHWDSISVS